jgi:hypothetical protein
MPGTTFSRPSEAEVVWWLKRALTTSGLEGREVREIIVDADSSYLHSRFRRQLEPTGTVWIGAWRPDLVCVVEGTGSERLVGFEVKSLADHEKGVVQAARYRAGVHEAYLCVPSPNAPLPDWLHRIATANGVGLLAASSTAVRLELPPAPLIPDPRVLQVTRRYLLGEVAARAFVLNRPLHYAAATFASVHSPDPWTAMRVEWELGEASVPQAFRGAEVLGLLSGGTVTAKGKALTDSLQYAGFSLRESRKLTSARARSVVDAPPLAALLRSVLLQHPAVDLIVHTLAREPHRPISAHELAVRAMRIDEGLARGVFGPPPENGQAWQIRPTTRFQLKAGLYDVGLIDTRPARGAGDGSGTYDAHVDLWKIGSVVHPSPLN